MMSGNPNWWSMHPQTQFVYGSSNPSSADHHHVNNNSDIINHPNQDFPLRSWTQLLRGGLSGGEEQERLGGSSSLFQQQKKLENWEDQVLNLNPPSFTRVVDNNNSHVKQESAATTCQLFGRLNQDDQFHANNNINRPSSNCWNQVMPVSSPTSCVTTLSNNNFLNFSAAAVSATSDQGKNSYENRRHHQDHSSECNSTGTGGVSNKKARVQQSTAQPALKVRKEKLGDRITALHQIVSPFGKTDTASVLSEAIGYIRFLQGQIEALSSPYMRNASGSTGINHQHSVQERSCLFPQEPSQFLNHDIGMDGRGASKQDSQGRATNDLRSRGLCLVPIACTQHMGSDNGADYWAPAALGGGF